MGGREFHGIHNPDGLFLTDRFRRAGRAGIRRDLRRHDRARGVVYLPETPDLG